MTYAKIPGVRKQVARLMTVRGIKSRWRQEFCTTVARYYAMSRAKGLKCHTPPIRIGLAYLTDEGRS